MEECPNGTISNNKECLIDDKNSSNSSNSDGEQKNSKPNYMLWIFIIIFALVLLIISLIICKKYCSKRKNDGELINDINTELRENKELVG